MCMFCAAVPVAAATGTANARRAELPVAESHRGAAHTAGSALEANANSGIAGIDADDLVGKSRIVNLRHV